MSVETNEERMDKPMKPKNKIPLNATGYKVVSLNTRLAGFRESLKRTLAEGTLARADQNRDGFYEVEVGGRCFYIHIYDAMKTVYLVGAVGCVAEFGKRLSSSRTPFQAESAVA